jgi:hypothetical protein
MDKSQTSVEYINIPELFELYKDNDYMTQKLISRLKNLPIALEMEAKQHEKRVSRTDFLTNEQKQFIQVFLSDNRYFYLHNKNSFYYYDNITYKLIKEDNIQHKLLSSISKDKTLMDWKYRTKINIIKQIKMRSLWKSIPDSITIQNVLNLLYPSIFSCKNHAKYFLTVIGDNILKKNAGDLIFLTKSKTKYIFTELGNCAYFTTGVSNVTNNLITKYHENFNYQNCRLLKLNDSTSIPLWKSVLQKYGLDILCVATHYSQRFENSENFIMNVLNETVQDLHLDTFNTSPSGTVMNEQNDADCAFEKCEGVKQYILYMKNNTPKDIVEAFCKHSLQEENNPSCIITWKNMHYIWKKYISLFSFPNMMYSNTLKSLLKDKFVYNEETDTFCNVTSIYLPCVSDFIHFWENTITIHPTSNEFVYTEQQPFVNELEADELCILFKKWVQDNSQTCCTNGNMSEQELLRIMRHYYPTIEIENNKIVVGISCKLWDKLEHLETALNSLKQIYFQGYLLSDECSLIGFDEAYDFYSTFCKKLNPSMKCVVVSKRFFEKFLSSTLSQYIDYDRFISSSWYV